MLRPRGALHATLRNAGGLAAAGAQPRDRPRRRGRRHAAAYPRRRRPGPVLPGWVGAARSAAGGAARGVCPSSAASCRLRRWRTKSSMPARRSVHALVTVAGNPVLSAPNGRRLDRALGTLEHVVAVDPYLNETTRHAHVLLPPVPPLARSHYDLALNAFAVRNVAKHVRAGGSPKTPGAAPRLGDSGGPRRHECLRRARCAALVGRGRPDALHPDRLLDLLLRARTAPPDAREAAGCRRTASISAPSSRGASPPASPAPDGRIDIAPEEFLREGRESASRRSSTATRRAAWC